VNATNRWPRKVEQAYFQLPQQIQFTRGKYVPSRFDIEGDGEKDHLEESLWR